MPFGKEFQPESISLVLDIAYNSEGQFYIEGSPNHTCTKFEFQDNNSQFYWDNLMKLGVSDVIFGVK